MLTRVSNLTYTFFILVLIHLITVSNLLRRLDCKRLVLPLLMKAKKKFKQTYGKSSNKRPGRLNSYYRRDVYWSEAFKRGRAFVGGFTVNIRKMIKFAEFCKF